MEKQIEEIFERAKKEIQSIGMNPVHLVAVTFLLDDVKGKVKEVIKDEGCNKLS